MDKLKNLVILIIGFIIMLVVTLLSYNIGVKDAELKQEILENHIENGNHSSIKFIWDEDDEALPEDGNLITIKYTKDNIVYLGL